MRTDPVSSSLKLTKTTLLLLLPLPLHYFPFPGPRSEDSGLAVSWRIVDPLEPVHGVKGVDTLPYRRHERVPNNTPNLSIRCTSRNFPCSHPQPPLITVGDTQEGPGVKR